MTSLDTSNVEMPKLDTVAVLGDDQPDKLATDGAELNERNENKAPQQIQAIAAISKPRRASESGIPASRPPQRRSSTSGTPDKSSTTPQGTPRGRIIPRENRSSTLRKSVSGIDSSSLRSAGSLAKENSPGAAGFELTRLRDDLRAKQKENDSLGDEVATLKGQLASKDRALARVTADAESLSARLLTAEASLAGKVKELRDSEAAANKLRSNVQDLERQADRLNRKLHSQPKGTGFSEAVATLEAEVRALKQENARLADDSRGAANLVRAKDKELDSMALEVEEARRILIQNGELENYILDMRRQLQEAGEERATLLQVQRQLKTDLALVGEEREGAKASAAATARELAMSNAKLKAAEENAAELSRELELRKGELTRVTAVASRAVHREANSIKEDGTVPFNQHKEEVTHLKGEISRLKEKLQLADKSAAATQLQIRHLYRRIDTLEGKAKVSPRAGGGQSMPGGTTASPGPAKSPGPAGEDTAATEE